MANKRRRRRGCLTALVLVFLFIAGALYLYWDNNAVVTEEFTFESSALPDAFDGFRIVQLSDIHDKQFGKNDSVLLDAVKKADPDIIVVTGDLLDERGSIDDILPLAEELPKIAPTYYITGNHEWSAKIVDSLTDTLEANGVTCLKNDYVDIQKGGEHIVLAGIHDPNGRADQKTPETLASEIQEAEGDPFWILLAHRNTLYETYGNLGADLLITGHAHGGLIRLPFTDGLISPNHTLFPKWTSGFYYNYPTPMFVSRGLGNVYPTFRILNAPQLPVITLRRGS
jgi:predicted MPP superfamily phosphohydrolase